MQNSKLVRLITLLNKKEQKRLDSFLRSPYHVKVKEQPLLSDLYKIICLYFFIDSAFTLSKKNVYQKIYPNDIYIKGRLDKLMTKLLKYFNHFLEFEHHSKTKNRASLHLAQANFFREKKAHKELATVIQKGRRIQKKNINKSFGDYYIDFLLEQEFLLYKSLLNNTRNTDTNLVETIEALDIYYLAQRLEYTARIKLQSYYVNTIDKKIHTAEKALSLLTKTNYLNVPLIEAYSCVLSLYRNGIYKGKESFEYLDVFLYKKETFFTKNDIRNLRTLLRTYAYISCNMDKKKDLKKVFYLYKKDLEKGFLYHGKNLLPSTVKNIVDLGLIVNENSWTHNFLQTHKEKITGTKTPHEVFNFNMANYYFHTEAYEEALDLLNSNYEDVYYKVSAKRLEIKILFEQFSPLLQHRMEAFKVFMFRQNKKTLTESQLKANNNFIDALKKILAPKTLGNPERIEKLTQSIKAADLVIERKWLLEKLEEQKH